MPAAIRLDITTEPALCDTCPAHNEAMAQLRGDEDEPSIGVTAAIYRLTIGAGYRQAAYLCPDCLARLRNVLGVEIRTALCGCVERHECYCAGNKEREA